MSLIVGYADYINSSIIFRLVILLSIGLFFGIVLGVTILLTINPRGVFILFLGGLILFYTPFQQGLLFTMDGVKVYPGDLVLASLFIFLLLKFYLEGFGNLLAQKSTRIFLLFFIWGNVAIIRGIQSYGHSAVGEARWYILLMIYYFFVITMFKNRQGVRSLINWVIMFIVIMFFFCFFEFFFFGGNEELIGQAAFRFLNSAEALLLSFLLVSLYLFFISGGIRRNNFLVIIILCILFTSLILAQVRSVWLAMAGGLIAVLVVLQKALIRSIVAVSMGFLFFALTASLVGNFIGEDVYTTVESSAVFLKDPREDPTGSWRLIGWMQNLEAAMKQPVWGEGLGRYSEWFDGHKWQRVAVHNGYIMHFLKFGLIGLFLLFTGLFYWYAEMRRYVQVECDRYYKFMGYAIQICVFMNLIYVFFYSITILFWVLMAVGTVLVRQSKVNLIRQVSITPGK